MTPPTHKVWRRLRKAPDLELLIKLTRIDGEEFVNIRDYVPSTKHSGHGTLFSIDLLGEVIESLQQLQSHLGKGKK